MSMRELVPDATRQVARQLRASGYEAYAVGGCVRDTLLEKAPHDWDLATNATPIQMKEAVAFPSSDAGVKHGTITFIVGGTPIETTSFRSDGSYSDGRHPDSVRFAQTIQEDLARRDFTINAMAWSPETGIVDPFGGERDLRARLLRCVNNPAARFAEDGLRIMRGLRIAACLELEIEARTAEALHRMSHMLKLVAAERIQAEFIRMMEAPNGRTLAALINEFADIVTLVFPELAPLHAASNLDADITTGAHDPWRHSLALLDALPADANLRMAALFHRLESAGGNKAPAGTVAPCGAQVAISARSVQGALKRLKFPRKSIEDVASLIAGLSLSTNDTMPQARRFLAQAGSARKAWRQLSLIRADSAACGRGSDAMDTLARFSHRIEDAIAQDTPLSPKELAINGADLIAIGWNPGPAIGWELARLFERVLDGDIENERGALLDAVAITPQNPAGK